MPSEDREAKLRQIIRLLDHYVSPDERPEMQAALQVDGNYKLFREMVR